MRRTVELRFQVRQGEESIKITPAIRRGREVD